MRFLALLLPIAAIACKKDDGDTAALGTLDPLALPFDVEGPYNAGYRWFPVTYSVLGQERTIGVNVWYPTEDNGGTEVSYIGLAPDPESFGDAQPAMPIHAGGYPLHAHSHGHQGYGGTSSDLMRYFASHGWVSVAPDHTDNLLPDNPDDLPAHFDAIRPMDVIAAVDAIAALPTDDPLAATITDQYVLSGHSRGCTTDWSVLGATFDPSNTADYCDGCDASQLGLFTDGSVVDPRVVAAIPMAGTYSTGKFGQTGFQAVDVPILSMTGTNDNEQSNVDQWGLIEGLDFSWLSLEGGCHQTFALGVCDQLDVQDGYRFVNTYAMAFARAHLLDDTGLETLELLNGTTELDSRAKFQKK